MLDIDLHGYMKRNYSEDAVGRAKKRRLNNSLLDDNF